MKNIRRVLLVEDDADDQYLFEDALKRIHPKIYCIVAGDGVQAIKILDEMLPVDLIFMDLNLPKMNGFECLAWVKASAIHKSIPVIIMTTSAREADSAKCLQLGALAYFSKPSDFNDLFNQVQQLITGLNEDKRRPPSIVE